MFCNFDGCYSKRDGGGRTDVGLRKLTDPVGLLLLRLQHDSTQRTARPDDVLAQTSAVDLETEVESRAAIDEQRRSEWMSGPACCSGLAKILR